MIDYAKAYYAIKKNYKEDEIKSILQKIKQKIEYIKTKCNNKYDDIEIIDAILNTKKDMHIVLKMFFVLYLSTILEFDDFYGVI